MGIISRKPIAIPLWVKFAIAVVAASLLTVIAVLMTSGGLEPVGGKPVLAGAILVIPLVLAAQFEWSPGISIALAFVAYFSVCFLAVWFFTRKKRLTEVE